MRTVPWLTGCITLLLWTVNANVEKAIFLAPSPVAIPNARPSLQDLRLDTLSAAARKTILSTQLSVEFPTDQAPRGLDSWYLLQGLEEGRRYEVRICWPATQPTDFWLDTYTLSQVFDTPPLIDSLAAYSEIREELGLESPGYSKDSGSTTSDSLVLLRVQSAASFYSTNRTLMDDPPPVDVDIILDPFILNILPRSLGPTVLYIGVVAVAAWYLSGIVYSWLISISRAIGGPPPPPPPPSPPPRRSFDSLPAELLLEIIQYINPEDYVSFALATYPLLASHGLAPALTENILQEVLAAHIIPPAVPPGIRRLPVELVDMVLRYLEPAGIISLLFSDRRLFQQYVPHLLSTKTKVRLRWWTDR